MDIRPAFTSLERPNDILELKRIISEMSDSLDILYSTTAPNGTISARQGRICLYKNGSSYEQWINVDGSTTWQRVDFASPLVSGDLILSTVTTARTGWTNVSTTYADKFMRINATPLTTGGSDTHTHSLAETNLPSHTHGAGSLAADSSGAHTHTITVETSTTSPTGNIPLGGNENANETKTTSSNGAHTHSISGSTAAVGSGTSFSGDNVPAYVQVTAFKKD